jgi:hypothetical protein
MIEDDVVYSLIDYDEEMTRDGAYVGMQWSENLKESMSNYLFRGLKPGGHLEAMLAQDYERAFFNADTHSRTVIWATAKWIRDNVPCQAWGSYEAVEFWIRNEEARNAFYTERSKQKMWTVLKEQND